MTRYVVDASVAAKWLIPEPLSEAALRLQGDEYSLYCPDLLYLEVANVIWKKVRSDDLDEESARPMLRALLDSPFRVEPASAMLPAAWEISIQYGRSVYDAVYLALAVALDAPLVTADRRLVRALESTSLRDRLVWVEDLAA